MKQYALLCGCCDRIIGSTERETIEQAIAAQAHYMAGGTSIVRYEIVTLPDAPEAMIDMGAKP